MFEGARDALTGDDQLGGAVMPHLLLFPHLFHVHLQETVLLLRHTLVTLNVPREKGARPEKRCTIRLILAK